MKKTIYLYDENPRQITFQATVLSCEKKEEEQGYQVILDKTAFFPEQGGQTPDKGFLNGIKVRDVQIKDGVVRHTTAQPLQVGELVKGEVDWAYRFSNMQQHSGEHIFSGIVYKKYGYHNVGFHLSDSIVTMDFDGALDAQQVEEVESEVNQVIYANLLVEVSYPSKQELETMEYRSKKELNDRVRIVTIPGVDVCACCAPHVASTGEIGMLRVMSLQNYKGGVRISMLCGSRALEAYREQARVVSSLMNLLSSAQKDLPERVKGLQEERQKLKIELENNRAEQLINRIQKISGEEKNVILFWEALEAKTIRHAVNKMTKKHEGICGIFCGTDQNGYQYILGSQQEDLRLLSEKLRQELQAKGGGSSQMIQGSLEQKQEKITTFLEKCGYDFSI